MTKTMILKPRLSEKAYGLSQTANVFVFQVPTEANRLTVKNAVTDQFSVTVTNVRMMNQKGKVKRSIRKNGRAVSGQRSDRKFAYVTLKKGDSLPIFASEEAEETKAKATEARQAKRSKK